MYLVIRSYFLIGVLSVSITYSSTSFAAGAQANLVMIEAGQQAIKGNYEKAESLYSAVLEQDNNHADALIQRAVVRRELKNIAGMQSDATSALQLVEVAISVNPRDYGLYHQRSLIMRLLGRYDQATKDIQTASKLAGGNRWQNDLQAIEVEKRMSQSAQY